MPSGTMALEVALPGLPGFWSHVAVRVELEQANLDAHKVEDLQTGEAPTRRDGLHEDLPNQVKSCLFFPARGNCV